MAEILVASALLLVSSVVVVSFIKSTKDENQKFEGAAECTQKAFQTISKFKTLDNRLTIPNWHSQRGALKPTQAEIPLHFERFDKFNIIDDPQNLTWNTSNSWMLPDTATNWALTLYSRFNDICSMERPGREITSGGPSLADQYYPSSGAPLKDQKVYLNIKRLNITSGALDCANAGGLQKIIPKGKNPAPESDIALQVKTTITYNDINNRSLRCTGETTLKSDGDPYPPQAMMPVNNLMPPNCPGAACSVQGFVHVNNDSGDINTGLNPPSSLLSSGNLFFAVAFNEPAVVMGCSLLHAVGAPPLSPNPVYQHCSSIASSPAGAANGEVIAVTGAVDAKQTGVKLRLTNLTAGYYTLYVKGFDQAQNESPVTSAQVCVRSPCPPPNTYSCAATPPDGCGGLCPRGTMSDCPPSSTYCPGNEPNDSCGNRCPTGTQDCGGGGNPDPEAGSCDQFTKCKDCEADTGKMDCCEFKAGKSTQAGISCCAVHDIGTFWVDVNGNLKNCRASVIDNVEIIDMCRGKASCDGEGCIDEIVCCDGEFTVCRVECVKDGRGCGERRRTDERCGRCDRGR